MFAYYGGILRLFIVSKFANKFVNKFATCHAALNGVVLSEERK